MNSDEVFRELYDRYMNRYVKYRKEEGAWKVYGVTRESVKDWQGRNCYSDCVTISMKEVGSKSGSRKRGVEGDYDVRNPYLLARVQGEIKILSFQEALVESL
jgi:hypothetical protein